MNDQLRALVAQANAEKVLQIASTIINNKRVSVRVICQARRTTSRATQQPSLMWKVDGKRVLAKDLMQAI